MAVKMIIVHVQFSGTQCNLQKKVFLVHIDVQIGDIPIIQKDVFLMSLERDSGADVQVEEERVQRRAGEQFFSQIIFLSKVLRNTCICKCRAEQIINICNQ